MKRIELNQNWRMRVIEEQESEWLDAVVPGSVYADLIASNRLEDPYWRDNERRALAVMENEFEYICDFEGETDHKADKVCLRFECLDTLADISGAVVRQ